MDAVLSRSDFAANGRFSSLCQRYLEKAAAVRYAYLAHSGTTALEVAALLAGTRPGDEVILPCFTYPSTANAFLLRGAHLRFADIRPDTFNLDERAAADRLNRRTKAIIAVHYGGVPCEMDRFRRISQTRRGVVLVEDAAASMGARYHEKPVGGLGDIGVFSFHQTKNLTCGEGGAILLQSAELERRANMMAYAGTNRRDFFLGRVKAYTWVEMGTSFLPSELQAAFLFAQLKQERHILARRRAIWSRYASALKRYEANGLVRFLHVPPHSRSNYHVFPLVFTRRGHRDHTMLKLAEVGVQAVIHYQPLHRSKMGRSLGYKARQFPVGEAIADGILRLPLHNALTDREQAYVIDRVDAILKRL